MRASFCGRRYALHAAGSGDELRADDRVRRAYLGM
jgi:hypothetical protein